jgi:hypothetical protein
MDGAKSGCLLMAKNCLQVLRVNHMKMRSVIEFSIVVRRVVTKSRPGTCRRIIDIRRPHPDKIPREPAGCVDPRLDIRQGKRPPASQCAAHSLPSPLLGEGGVRGAIAKRAPGEGLWTLRETLIPHLSSLGFASARTPSPARGEGSGTGAKQKLTRKGGRATGS